jgi:hypothetical protein
MARESIRRTSNNPRCILRLDPCARWLRLNLSATMMMVMMKMTSDMTIFITHL